MSEQKELEPPETPVTPEQEKGVLGLSEHLVKALIDADYPGNEASCAVLIATGVGHLKQLGVPPESIRRLFARLMGDVP